MDLVLQPLSSLWTTGRHPLQFKCLLVKVMSTAFSCEVHLASGEVWGGAFRKNEVEIIAHIGELDSASEQKPTKTTGLLCYLSAYEAFEDLPSGGGEASLQILLPPQEFETLKISALKGLLPRTMTVDLSGDAVKEESINQLSWNNIDSRPLAESLDAMSNPALLQLTRFTYEIPLTPWFPWSMQFGFKEPQDQCVSVTQESNDPIKRINAEDRRLYAETPPSRQQFNNLQEWIQTLAKQLRRMRFGLVWQNVILTLLLIVLIFHWH